MRYLCVVSFFVVQNYIPQKVNFICHFPDSRLGEAGAYPDKVSGAKNLAVTSSTVVGGGKTIISSFDKMRCKEISITTKQKTGGTFIMKKQEKLAVRVMESVNEFTQWNFQLKQEGNIYFVGTELRNQDGQEITIFYLIGEEEAELQVTSTNSKYDDEFVNKKVNEILREYPVYTMGNGKEHISIKSPMTLEVLDKDMVIIIRKRMVDMVQAMTDIIKQQK